MQESGGCIPQWVTNGLGVVCYVPELRFLGADGITLHHLLAMTSGLPALGTETYGDRRPRPHRPGLVGGLRR